MFPNMGRWGKGRGTLASGTNALRRWSVWSGNWLYTGGLSKHVNMLRIMGTRLLTVGMKSGKARIKYVVLN